MLNKSLTAPIIFYRTYSRLLPSGKRESWANMVDRTTKGLIELGKLTPEETELIRYHQSNFTALTSGRWQWVGGTEWASKPENYQGVYNCSNLVIDSFQRMAYAMDLLMQGCGVGTIIETEIINKLPSIKTKLELTIEGKFGEGSKHRYFRKDSTSITAHESESDRAVLVVGDSRQGWTDAYLSLLRIAAGRRFYTNQSNQLTIDLSNIRAAGTPIKGFGGVANPVGLNRLFTCMVEILNGAVGRKLNSLEVCLLMDEAALAVVAGNVRRSANIRQFSSDDVISQTAKDNLWIESDKGWHIDPERDALRMSNHTRVFHHKPRLEECIEAVRKQYYSGEGAIQWAGEAVARANADLLSRSDLKATFLRSYAIDRKIAQQYLYDFYTEESRYMDVEELDHRMMRYGTNPCGEIILNDNFCNLSDVHLNLLDPFDLDAQENAFKAAALSASALLHHRFNDDRMQLSRELDPIVGVSFTGLFDFFVHAFGVDWLRWWESGRPEEWNSWHPLEERWDKMGFHPEYSVRNAYMVMEQFYLTRWRSVVEDTVWEYCDRHNLKRPNRCTTVQPSGSKSLLTGASPGWHPPKAQRFIRRVTFRKNDPVALACSDLGYSIIPSQSDKDENGNLLNDPFDPRCTEWLAEVPIAVSWADLPGADKIDISQFSALAQFDFYMQIQKHYTSHNTSATIEFREDEIEALGSRIWKAIESDEGYISAALLARFDSRQTFPRLPFEPIDKDTYDRLVGEMVERCKIVDFDEALALRDREDGAEIEIVGSIGCDSDKCLLPEVKP